MKSIIEDEQSTLEADPLVCRGEGCKPRRERRRGVLRIRASLPALPGDLPRLRRDEAGALGS